MQQGGGYGVVARIQDGICEVAVQGSDPEEFVTSYIDELVMADGSPLPPRIALSGVLESDAKDGASSEREEAGRGDLYADIKLHGAPSAASEHDDGEEEDGFEGGEEGELVLRRFKPGELQNCLDEVRIAAAREISEGAGRGFHFIVFDDDSDSDGDGPPHPSAVAAPPCIQQ